MADQLLQSERTVIATILMLDLLIAKYYVFCPNFVLLTSVNVDLENAREFGV